MVVKKTVNKSGFGMRNLWQLSQGTCQRLAFMHLKQQLALGKHHNWGAHELIGVLYDQGKADERSCTDGVEVRCLCGGK